MKKSSILFILLALLAFAPTASAEWILPYGSGTKNDPYLVDVDVWRYLRDNVQEGVTYKGKYFKLTKDIYVDRYLMLGDGAHPFRGIFDGNGYTIHLDIDAHGDYNLAPFRYIRGATIMNLRVDGFIHAGAFTGGIVAHVSGTDNHIINCRSSVKFSFINSNTSLYTYQILSGGLVGKVDGNSDASLYIENSLFDGWFTTPINYCYRCSWGGLVGSLEGDKGEVFITNSLVAPTEIQQTYYYRDWWRCFVWDDEKDENMYLTNCYYKAVQANTVQAQGATYAGDMTQMELRTALGGAWKADGETAVVPVMKSIPFAGSGTIQSPYQISSETDWDALAYLVNNGYRNFENKFLKQMNDITVSETIPTNGTPTKMVGSSESSSFKGHYDGDNHTLTINYTDNGNNHYCAPFRFINRATIENLHVDGTIVKGQKKHAGGFVGQAFGTNSITNCRSSVDIQSSTDGDGSHGGFLGDLRGGATHFENCVFDGKLQGTSTKKWGGFVGWVASGCRANFVNCLFTPTLVDVKNDDNKTFARKDGTVNFSNSYYTQTLGSAQGKEAVSISGTEYDNGTTVTVTPYGTAETGGDNINLTAYLDGSSYNPCITFGDVIYSGSGNNVKLNLSQVGETPEGTQANTFFASNGSHSGTENPYTLTVGNDNTTISLAPTDYHDHAGTEADPYLIYTAEQWKIIAFIVNVHGVYSNEYNGYSGKYFKLMADITLTENHSDGNSLVMVGNSTSDNTKFRGTFDGNGHTITLNITDSSSDDYCAPFRYLKGGTIKNLHVAGTIVKTDNAKNAGGIVGKAEGTNTISNCRSSVDIQFNKDGDVSSGGFIGELRDGSSNTTTFTNCLFDGKLQGSNAEKWGGFVGWVANGCTANFNNCLFNPTTVSIDNNGNKTFARHDGTVNVNNCYYTTLLNDAQGATNASTYNNEQLLAALGLGWETIVENETEKVVPIMSVYPFSGDGTENSPYLITSTEDWNHLASNQFMGVSYNGKCFQLTDNISVTRMVGYDLDHAFQGTFDGDGNTITVSYGTATTPANIQYCAPFKNTYRATIKNLCTAGTIYTSSTHAGGVVGRNGTENLTMTNVKSSVTINSTYNGNANHGGLVGYAINATLEGCVFTGSLLGVNSQGCGGLLGWKAYTDPSNATFTDCLFAPTQVTVGTSGSFTIANGATDLVTINNCYYTQDFGTGQGALAHSITPGDYVTIENAGTNPTEYEVSGLTCYNSGIMFDEVLYAGQNETVSLNLTCTPPDGYECNGFFANDEPLTNTDNPYSLTMPNADVTITTTFEVQPWDGEGTEASPYLIYYPIQLDLLSTNVNNGNNYTGTYFKLMNDLVYDHSDLGTTESNYTPIGSEGHRFSGSFDGNGHTISGIRVYRGGATNADQYVGLFGYLDGNGFENGHGEVKNVILTDDVFAGYQYTGGIAGFSNCGIIDNCHVTSSVTIHAPVGFSHYHGGIVGYNHGADSWDAVVSNCTSAATLTKETSDTYFSWGAIVGWNGASQAYGRVTHNLAIGATLPECNSNTYGAVVGANNSNGILTNNYYINCTVAGIADATSVGCGNSDVTGDDGAVPGNKIIFLDDQITSDAANFTIPAYDEYDERTFSVASFGATVSLSYEPSNQVVTYLVDNEAITGNSFTMPNQYVEDVYTVYVSATDHGFELEIAGYGDNDGGYVLLATPVGTINPENVSHMFDNEYDLYAFDQNPEDGLEWRNYKANTFDLETGHGYLYANSEDVTLIFPGTPYHGDGQVTLSKTAGAEWEGWNLVGNPFNEIAYIADGRGFYTLDGDGKEVVISTSTSVEAMEGMFVIAQNDGETMTFTTTRPANIGKSMLVLNLSQGKGIMDRAIVRFNEGDLLPKFQLNRNSTKVYIPMDGQDYAMVRSEGMGVIPVNFKAKENGTYTLSLSTEDVTFDYLHLVDNLTGNDVDLLPLLRGQGGLNQPAIYTFTASTTDYESRFKLVFATKDGPSIGSGTFAFNNNGNWIINNDGDAILQVIDVNGQILSSETVNGSVSKAINVAPGVYVIRLINGNDVKTQKIVIE